MITYTSKDNKYKVTCTGDPYEPVASSRDGKIWVNSKENDLKLAVLARIKKVSAALNITESDNEI